jgi:hypothetical protein
MPFCDLEIFPCRVIGVTSQDLARTFFFAGLEKEKKKKKKKREIRQ